MTNTLSAQPLYIQMNFWLLIGSGLLVVAMTLMLWFRKALSGQLSPAASMWKLPEVPMFRGSNFPLPADHILMLSYVGMNVLMIAPCCFEQPTSATESPEEAVDILTVWINTFFNFAIYLPFIIRYGIITRMKFTLKFSSLVFTVLALISVYVCSAIVQASGLAEWIIRQTGTPETQYAIRQITESSGDINTVLPVLVSAVIIAPLVEELFFRGFIYNILKKYSGIIPAALASGLFFGAVHISLVQCVILTFFGIIQCFLYERTRSIVYPILMHMIFNGLAMTMLLLLEV